MIILPGNKAFSTSREETLLAQLREHIPSVSKVYTYFYHFVDVSRELSHAEEAILLNLLYYGIEPEEEFPIGQQFLVIPRHGTISPWSSKATDISNNCGLTAINRIERGILYHIDCDINEIEKVKPFIHDRMTEEVLDLIPSASILFDTHTPTPLETIDIKEIAVANARMGLALSGQEIVYLYENYKKLNRTPTDVELMMFAQANSEHCRHKIFNAKWIIDNKEQDKTLFQMIRNTHEQNPSGILSAYHDNAAVMVGWKAPRFYAHPITNEYYSCVEEMDILMKVETHNHPTAIAPFPGAATGSGGEIRDEAATGTGAKSKAGICGFSVSNLNIPDYPQPWEEVYGKPDHIVSPLEIMIKGPIGAASFNNEFGRPNLAGYFRSFEQKVNGEVRGYHKPIMIAGGMGNIRNNHVDKHQLPVNTFIIIIGGPAMLIGLGGGAASSMASGDSTEDLDFASVQRSNPEMQRRCQEVIDRCNAHDEFNPILSIHDMGAGGLSNAVPEIIHDANRGGTFELRAVPNAELNMSPKEIWCNESQERYVLAIGEDRLESFKAICDRERCPYAIIGTATEEMQLTLNDEHFNNTPVDIPMEVLLGKPPKTTINVKSSKLGTPRFVALSKGFERTALRLLRLPSIASKNFLITIGDRSITGLVTRDQMVGPWQVPVADVAVTATSPIGNVGEAMAIGERAPVALVDPVSSGIMAVGEAITNIAAADIENIRDIRFSANWMASPMHIGEETALYDTVKAIGEHLCPDLGIVIPVGKDSLSMKTVWDDKSVTSPLSLNITAFAPVGDVRKTLTPQLRTDCGDTELLLIDLGHCRLGGSAFAQVYGEVGNDAPTLDEPNLLKDFFSFIQAMRPYILAYHDRSDGGAFITLCEMAFAGHCGITIDTYDMAYSTELFFNEELGAVIQIKKEDRKPVYAAAKKYGLVQKITPIGKVNDTDRISFQYYDEIILDRPRAELQKIWKETSYHIQSLRDNPECAKQEFENDTLEIKPKITFDTSGPYIKYDHKPKVAILREQGVNGQVEMANAFDSAGFNAIDVHMSDIISGRVELSEFKGLAACGGFSYGDVLGAGGGWAKSILFNNRAKDQFSDFFYRLDTFALGVCNGCQMMSQIKEIIPGAGSWPRFMYNKSEQFEARYVQVKILPSPSILLTDMEDAIIPIVVAHGEGRVNTENTEKHLISMCYVDETGNVTEKYPANPNGSTGGATAFTTPDGRFTIMMPHPERLIRSVHYSWHPEDWSENGPWFTLFNNARRFLS